MTAYLAVFMTLGQLIAIAAAFFLKNDALFSDMVINGSPFYLVMNLFNRDSAFKGPGIYMVFLGFHVVKYLCIWRAKVSEEHPDLSVLSIGAEILYLCISGYYLY
ncbi:MAG: hypothetical protein EBV03_06040 [Proteobacteria bacterium]|nr:hypothetical protein [Pseudomonadota bacterium]